MDAQIEKVIAERKAQYEQSALKQLMDAEGHEICTICYCCDLVWQHEPCWQCGGFEPELDDDVPDVCSECDGEGEISFQICMGGCRDKEPHEAVRSLADGAREGGEDGK